MEKFFHDELIPEVETLLDVVADLNEKALGAALKVLEAKAKNLEAQKDISDGEIHFRLCIFSQDLVLSAF